jgi:hypothetical protein
MVDRILKWSLMVLVLNTLLLYLVSTFVNVTVYPQYNNNIIHFLQNGEGGQKGNRGGGFDQTTLYSCIEISQWNSFVQLIYAHFKKRKITWNKNKTVSHNCLYNYIFFPKTFSGFCKQTPIFETLLYRPVA